MNHTPSSSSDRQSSKSACVLVSRALLGEIVDSPDWMVRKPLKVLEGNNRPDATPEAGLPVGAVSKRFIGPLCAATHRRTLIGQA